MTRTPTRSEPRGRAVTGRVVTWAVLLAAAWYGFVLLITVVAGSGSAAAGSDSSVLSLQRWLDPASWTDGTGTEFVANLLLFAPLGALLAVGLPRIPAIALIGAAAAASLLIEVAQLDTGRVSDPRDLVANTIGAAVAVLLVRAIRRRTT